MDFPWICDTQCSFSTSFNGAQLIQLTQHRLQKQQQHITTPSCGLFFDTIFIAELYVVMASSLGHQTINTKNGTNTMCFKGCDFSDDNWKKKWICSREYTRRMKDSVKQIEWMITIFQMSLNWMRCVSQFSYVFNHTILQYCKLHVNSNTTKKYRLIAFHCDFIVGVFLSFLSMNAWINQINDCLMNENWNQESSFFD